MYAYLRSRREGKIYAYAPLLLYLLIYSVTCLIGTTLALAGNASFIEAFVANTGIPVPLLNHHELVTNLWLLYGTPVLIFIGYKMVISRDDNFLRPVSVRVRQPIQLQWVALSHAIFYVLLAWATVVLYRAQSFANFGAWLHYDAWVLARWQVFSRVGFLSFVNIYTFVPLAAALAFVVTPQRKRYAVILRWLPPILAVAIQTLLFQKKTVLIAEFILITVCLLYQVRQQKLTFSYIAKQSFTSCGVAGISFILVIGAPIITQYVSLPQTSSPNLYYHIAGQLIKNDKALPWLQKNTALNKELPAVHHKHRVGHASWSHFFSYTLMALLTRTSVPTLYYPIFYPALHPFYGLDLGQDMLGYEKMPDDNLVVWNKIYPDKPGAVTAPAQFVLYSQVGLMGALLGSFLFGILLAHLWRLTYHPKIPLIISALLGSMILMFAFYVTVDSGHNALLASYGCAWGILFILVLWGLAKTFRLSEHIPLQLQNFYRYLRKSTYKSISD